MALLIVSSINGSKEGRGMAEKVHQFFGFEKRKESFF